MLRRQYLYVRYCAHILNLIVVSRLNELHVSVATIQNVAKSVRSSTTRLQTFKKYVVQSERPEWNCHTRWNSTY